MEWKPTPEETARFFADLGDKWMHASGEPFTVEGLYQHFKARMLAEMAEAQVSKEQ
jgi:hypothetical protein